MASPPAAVSTRTRVYFCPAEKGKLCWSRMVLRPDARLTVTVWNPSDSGLYWEIVPKRAFDA